MPGIPEAPEPSIPTRHDRLSAPGSRQAAFAAVASSPAGLTQAEAGRRLRLSGPNQLRLADHDHPLVLLAGQFRSPLVLILIGAAAVTFAIGETAEALVIAGIVVASSALAFVQEYRASGAMQALRKRLAVHARVRRDGTTLSVPATEVVPGDVVALAAGTLVPADGLLLEAVDLHLDEAALTGESFPIEKEALAEGVPSEGNQVRMGTSVRSGEGLALILKTGVHTQYGGIAQLFSTLEPETSFARGVRRFGMMMTQIMLAMLVVILPVNLLLGRPLLETLLFSAALAVGLTPELLPAIVSVTLARGGLMLSRAGVLVRRLVAIENLGAIDVLCTDKTGTLTEGLVRLHQATDPAGSASSEVLSLAALNAALQTSMPNPLDTAIMEAAAVPAGTKLDEVPYDFDRKRLSVLVGRPQGNLLVCKGAVASILPICGFVLNDGAPTPLDEHRLREEEERCAAWGGKGLRVLAVAIRDFGTRDHCDRGDETGLTLVGYLHFSDRLKEGVTDVVARLRQKGVLLKILTGDNRYVAASVASSVGLDAERMMTGDDVARLTDRALAHRADGTDVFAQLTPDQKERVVTALRRGGKVVGYLGDGINDAPPLRAADLGISVDTGVEAAKEAADVVLLQRDLGVLLDGIIIGRTAFANTIKYITVTTSANLGNMISMALASLFLPFLPMLAKQILLNNSLSDLPMLAISTDRIDEDVLAHPGRWNLDALLRSMIAYGLISSLFDILAFLVLIFFFRATDVEFQTGWFVLSLLTEVAIIWVMRTRRRFYQSPASPVLLTLSAVVAAVAAVLPYSPVAEAMGLVPLPIGIWAGLLAIVLGYIAASELLKTALAKPQYFRSRGYENAQ